VSDSFDPIGSSNRMRILRRGAVGTFWRGYHRGGAFLAAASPKTGARRRAFMVRTLVSAQIGLGQVVSASRDRRWGESAVVFWRAVSASARSPALASIRALWLGNGINQGRLAEPRLANPSVRPAHQPVRPIVSGDLLNAVVCLTSARIELVCLASPGSKAEP